MHFDDDAGEDAFRHEAFVFVADDAVVFGVPVVAGRCGGEEVGGDVSAGFFGDFVAEFELFHELKELGVEVVVLLVVPNGGEVLGGELAEVLFDPIAVQYFIDGSGAPVGFEDEELF